MRRKWKHKKLIFFISIALTFFSFITLYADTTTYQYDDNARKVRIERGTRTYDISGNVTSGGSPMAGVTITLSGARSDTTTTDSSGNYIFDGLLNDNYTITPSKAGYTFTPASRNVTINSLDVTDQNFTGISGTPIPPSNLAAATISSSQINLSWTDNSTNETGFKIERKTGAAGTYAQIATVGANVTTYANTGLTASTTYYYRVRAYNASGDSAYSNEVSTTTTGVAPSQPSNLAAATISSSQINLSWTDNSTNETGFKIERKTGVSGTYAQIATVGANVTTYANTGLTAGTTYYYRVRAYNASGDSAYSNEASATTMSGTTMAVRIARATPLYFSTLQAAYNAAISGDIIQSQALHFTENLAINRNISVTFDGGYDSSFVSNSGNKTYIKGMITTTVGGGTVTIKNFVTEK